MAKNASDFKSANALKYIGANARAVMQRHQPYQRVHRREPPALGLLHWFNRMDKHRAVQITAVGAPSIFTLDQLKITHSRGAKIIEVRPCLAAGQRLIGETEVVSIRFADSGPDPQVEMYGTPPLNPSFGHPPPDLRGIEISQSITQVREAIAAFANLIP